MTETENTTEVVTEPVEVIEVVDLDRPFLTTSFSSYTVVEGMLLMLVLILFVKLCVNIVKGGFSWLW